MARTIKRDEYESRRAEIVEAAQRLVYSKGYEQMSIQDILDDLHISKGAFYHYFDSKLSLLEALIERMVVQVLEILNPIVADEHLPAPEKLHRVFDVAARWKTDRKDVLLTLVNVWYADKNAVMRLKAQTEVLPLIAPLVTAIIQQGIREGAFHTAYPDQASWIFFSLLQSFGDTLVGLITRRDTDVAALRNLETLSASYQDAVERVLGAEPDTLPLFDTTILREWFPFSTS